MNATIERRNQLANALIRLVSAYRNEELSPWAIKFGAVGDQCAALHDAIEIITDYGKPHSSECECPTCEAWDHAKRLLNETTKTKPLNETYRTQD